MGFGFLIFILFDFPLDFLPPTKKQLSDWAKLGQKKYRRELGQFLIEGAVCVREALKSKAKLEAILVLSSRSEEWEEDLDKLRLPIYTLNRESFSRITQLETSQGIVGIGKMFTLPPRDSRFALAVEQVSDPGNCGGLIRVADFFGASMLYLGTDSAEIWNEKVVRGSMGSVFHQPVKEHVVLPDLIKKWKGTTAALVSHGGERLAPSVFASQTHPSASASQTHPSASASQTHPSASAGGQGGCLLVLGHETRGLDPSVARSCTVQLTLEPHGGAESLNLVTAAAVASFALTVR